jgi:hypothetical protein
VYLLGFFVVDNHVFSEEEPSLYVNENLIRDCQRALSQALLMAKPRFKHYILYSRTLYNKYAYI